MGNDLIGLVSVINIYPLLRYENKKSFLRRLVVASTSVEKRFNIT